MSSSDLHLYLFYVGGVLVIWLLIFVVTEIRKRRRATFRKQILKTVFEASPSLREYPHLPRYLSQMGGRPEPIPVERRQKWEEARQLARAGWNIDQIAQHLSIGRDETKIAILADYSSTGTENLLPSAQERPSRVRRLAEEGVPLEEIGRRLGMSLQEIKLILHLK
ncbi:MAG: hypothetical protein HY709_11890 [Candidatus Latescibacteria bacterium]|nr:hypothetical protein [Candidatus Latescibacterota bacterium]